MKSINGNRNPLILIDDNPVFFDEFRWIPISLIERIDILKTVASTTVYGFQGGNGVINLITKVGGGTGKYIPPDYSANQKISGYNTARLFYSPQHINDSISDANPDLRYTLFWNPEVNLESNKETTLNYFNADNASIIRIIAEGITKDGILITGTAKYEIR